MSSKSTRRILWNIPVRRVMWMTHSHLMLWFDTWKDYLIQFGFTRALAEEEKANPSIAGEVFFLKGQRRWILNID